MKKIINGKRYDTDKAQCVAEYANTYDRGDFHWYEEALYQTPSGSWFLAGEGHAASKYARSVAQNERGPGEDLLVLSEVEARAWLEAHDKVKELEDYFGGDIVDA